MPSGINMKPEFTYEELKSTVNQLQNAMAELERSFDILGAIVENV